MQFRRVRTNGRRLDKHHSNSLSGQATAGTRLVGGDTWRGRGELRRCEGKSLL